LQRVDVLNTTLKLSVTVGIGLQTVRISVKEEIKDIFSQT